MSPPPKTPEDGPGGAPMQTPQDDSKDEKPVVLDASDPDVSLSGNDMRVRN